MLRRALPLLAALLAFSAPVSAQIRAVAPGGVLAGVVRDSASGLPVAYALVTVVGRDQQVFSGASGRFVLNGMLPGPAAIRIRQVGYHPLTLALAVESGVAGETSALELAVGLVPRPLVLPELAAAPGVCLGMREAAGAAPEGGTILDEAYQTAERILTLERQYPFVLEYQLTTAVLDSTYTPIGGVIDTVRRESRNAAGYRLGRVLDRPGTRFERVNAFTTSGIAGEEFQRTHCFWYAGRDSSAGRSGYRIDFGPRPDLRSVDWAGSIIVDSASISLLKAEARIVNVPARGTNVLSVVCTILYRPIYPGLPQESEAKCVSSHRGPPREIRVERWLLVNRTFTGREPGAPGSPQRR